MESKPPLLFWEIRKRRKNQRSSGIAAVDGSYWRTKVVALQLFNDCCSSHCGLVEKRMVINMFAKHRQFSVVFEKVHGDGSMEQSRG